MKRRIVTLVLFVGAIASRMAYSDSWNPGNPKPPAPVPDPWLAQIGDFFSGLWTFFMI